MEGTYEAFIYLKGCILKEHEGHIMVNTSYPSNTKMFLLNLFQAYVEHFALIRLEFFFNFNFSNYENMITHL